MKKKLLTIVTLCMFGCASVAWCMNKNKGYDSDTEDSPRTEKFAHFVDEVKRGSSSKRKGLDQQVETYRVSGDFENGKKVGCRCSSDCYIL